MSNPSPFYIGSRTSASASGNTFDDDHDIDFDFVAPVPAPVMDEKDYKDGWVDNVLEQPMKVVFETTANTNPDSTVPALEPQQPQEPVAVPDQQQPVIASGCGPTQATEAEAASEHVGQPVMPAESEPSPAVVTADIAPPPMPLIMLPKSVMAEVQSVGQLNRFPLFNNPELFIDVDSANVDDLKQILIAFKSNPTEFMQIADALFSSAEYPIESLLFDAATLFKSFILELKDDRAKLTNLLLEILNKIPQQEKEEIAGFMKNYRSPYKWKLIFCINHDLEKIAIKHEINRNKILAEILAIRQKYSEYPELLAGIKCSKASDIDKMLKPLDKLIVDLSICVQELLLPYLLHYQQEAPGDGNCQFHAIVRALSEIGIKNLPNGERLTHNSLRQAAVAYISSNSERFEHSIPFDYLLAISKPYRVNYLEIIKRNIREDDFKAILDSYCSLMANAGVWGDEITLRAIADIFPNVGITVIRSEGPARRCAWTIYNEGKSENIIINHLGAHYNLIICNNREVLRFFSSRTYTSPGFAIESKRRDDTATVGSALSARLWSLKLCVPPEDLPEFSTPTRPKTY